ncbi:hypothetical protein [Priestia megaterium]|uniref:hypothetical protein n=1 Tax=Priestia megaterium TaxID=1404 RepID=UPI002FFF96BD
MYLNSYPYGFSQTYNNMYEFRSVANLVGTFISIANDIPLSTFTIPAGTRVFIHKVRFDPAGNELATIVFPEGTGGGCVAGATEVSGSMLTSPFNTGTILHGGHHYGPGYGTPPRPPR